MPIELIEQLAKNGLVGLAAAAVLYLANRAFHQGFSHGWLTIGAVAVGYSMVPCPRAFFCRCQDGQC